MEIAISLVTVGGFGLVLLRERWRQVVDSRVALLEVYQHEHMREDLLRFIATEREQTGAPR